MSEINPEPEKLDLPPAKPQLDIDAQSETPARFVTEIPYRIYLQQQKQKTLEKMKEEEISMRRSLIREIEIERSSKIIAYFSTNILDSKEVEAFYQMFSYDSRFDNLDLFLFSFGGIPDDAFKMSRLCRQHTHNRFGVLIPYKAKSAATLLSLGADELVMGPSSEMGPIDPMISVPFPDGQKYLAPAQAIKDGLDFFEERIKKQPENALLYRELTRELDPHVIGAYQRAIDSSKQYAEILLTTGLLKDSDDDDIKKVARELTERYKSHGFVIDTAIARSEYGLNVTDAESNLWDKMWRLYTLFQVHLEENPKAGTIIQTADAELVLPAKQFSE